MQFRRQIYSVHKNVMNNDGGEKSERNSKETRMSRVIMSKSLFLNPNRKLLSFLEIVILFRIIYGKILASARKDCRFNTRVETLNARLELRICVSNSAFSVASFYHLIKWTQELFSKNARPTRLLSTCLNEFMARIWRLLSSPERERG